MADPVPVDVFPCLHGVERELVGGYTDHGAVNVVQFLDLEGQAPAQEMADSRERTDGIEFGAGEFG